MRYKVIIRWPKICKQVFFFLKKISAHTFPKLYMSHVRPVLEYAGTVWCPYLVGDRETLEKVQKRMVRMIPGLRGSYEDKLRDLGMTTLQRRRERGDMIQTWRILTGKDRVDPANCSLLRGQSEKYSILFL